MKPLLWIVSLLASSALFGNSLMKSGEETDYVGTALVELHTVGSTPGLSSSNGFKNNNEHGLFGWHILHIGAPNWPNAPYLVGLRLTEALEGDHWKILAPTHMPVPNELPMPSQFLVTATRGEERLQIVVTMFPQPDGVVSISFSQTTRHS